ncbi:MAG: hypothetical protein A2X45_07695 [Lentisphaerae bacterium GWF2_50_93]|nr:MAG: hypothetical protein A2X45_07695 [Lentisphaerae bacterium GWF2_50_93]
MNKLILAAILACMLSSTALLATDDKETKAVKAAKAWLELIDSEKYAESWDAAAAYFKNALTKEKWLEAVAPVRKPLGKLVTRKIDTKDYKTELPGTPDGEYYILQFKTSFENKKTAVETVTMMLEKDGSWKSSGYFIK